MLTSKSSSKVSLSKSYSDDSGLESLRPSDDWSRRGEDISYGVKSLNFFGDGDWSRDSPERLASDEEELVAGPIESCSSSRVEMVGKSPKLVCLKLMVSLCTVCEYGNNYGKRARKNVPYFSGGCSVPLSSVFEPISNLGRGQVGLLGKLALLGRVWVGIDQVGIS